MRPGPPHVPEPVIDAVSIWLSTHDEVAPGVVEGLYVVGSVALDDWTTTSDVDVVAVVADPAEPEVAATLAAAHLEFTARSEQIVDGPYVAWGDLVVPAGALHRPWVLDGAFHLDGECFELNPVTWYTLATYGIAARGDDPARIGVPVDLADRRHFVVDNLDTYWRGVGRSLESAIADDERVDGFDGAVLEWVALGVTRMLYTFETGDVTSKSGAGHWGRTRLAEFADVLDAAVDVRHAPGTVDRVALDGAIALVARVLAEAGV